MAKVDELASNVEVKELGTGVHITDLGNGVNLKDLGQDTISAEATGNRLSMKIAISI